MKFNLTLEPGFDSLYDNFLKKYPTLLNIEGIAPHKIDVGNMSHAYHTNNIADVSIDENANANEDVSPNNYQTEVTKGILKLEGYYLLWRYAKKRFNRKYADKLIRSIWKGDLYFHDASGGGVQSPYCISFSTTNIMLEGRPYGQLHSLPPKRADSFIAQVIETTMDMSQAFVGAVAPADLIVNYCYYAKKENLSEKRVLNDLQKFVHVVNNKFRVGGQSPFCNISLFDRPNLIKVFSNYVYPDGSNPDFEYIIHVQKLFGAWFATGDPTTGLPYRFPVCTVNLSVNKDREIEDEDFLNWVSNFNIDKGVFNIYINEGNKIATCCRLSNQFTQTRADTFGNGGVNLGSHRVVTLNLPRVAIESWKDKNTFFEVLRKRLEEAKDLLLIHREEILKRRVDRGFLNFFKPLNWLSLDMLFSTIGIIGVYEMCYNMGLPMEEEEGQVFAEEVLQYIEKYAQNASKEYGVNFNVEEIPGESASPALAKKDRFLFTNSEFKLYSNQYLPLYIRVDMVERIKITGKFMQYLSGGGILHLNIAEQIQSPVKMKKLIKLTTKSGVEHFAINYGFGVCENGHSTICGISEKCSICNGRIKDRLTRVIGYFTKTSSWNETRRDYEFPRRHFGRV